MAHSSGSHQPPTPTHEATNGSSEEAAQQRIEREAREILRGYPVAAGLTGIADVISHLSPLAPTPPSFFPNPGSSSLQSNSSSLLPAEPLFDTYAREIEVLMRGGGGNRSIEEEQWAQYELARVVGSQEMRQQYQIMQQSGTYGAGPPLNPPFPYISPTTPLPPVTSNSLSHQFLDLARFPAAPVPSTFENPTPTADQSLPSENFDFLDALVSEELSRYPPPRYESQSPNVSRSASPIKLTNLPPLPSSEPHTPSLPHRHQQSHLQIDYVPSSSPDPLMIGVAGPSRPPPSQPYPKPSPRSTFDGVLVPQRHSKEAVSNPFQSPHSKRSYEVDSSASPHVFQGSSPLKSMVSDSHWTPASSDKLGDAFNEDAGVESAVKRFRLESGKNGNNVASSGGSGRGRVLGNESKNVVDRISDLLSDLFSADDSHILDTSTAALGSSAPNPQLRSPSRTTSANVISFFRTTAVAPTDSAPLLSTLTLSKLLKLVQLVGSKHKAEEMLEEVEDAGLSRMLKLLERSWDGVIEQDYWESDALKPREDKEETVTAKGKGKGKSKGKGKGKSASPGKRKKSAGDGEEEDSEGDYEGRASSSQGNLRRSSRSPSRTRSPTLQESEEVAAAPLSEEYWDGSRITSTNRSLRNLSDAILSARAALAVLTLPGVSLPKHLFSSDYLLALLSLLRHCLDALLIPLLEAPPTSSLAELFTPAFIDVRDRIVEIVDSLSNATELLAILVKQEEMSDDLVIASVYFSLAPFFHEGSVAANSATGKRRNSNVDGSEKGTLQQAVKGVRSSSLNLIRRVYARYTDQRNWIIEEILTNLGRSDATGSGSKKTKGAIRLRTGHSIQTVSALLLHLVQTCPSDLTDDAKKIVAVASTSTVNGADADGDVTMMEGNGDGDGEDNGAVLDKLSRTLLEPAYDSASLSARTIVGVLLQRSCKAGKAASGTADAEYRAVLDNLLLDLLSTLHMPEWPGSELLLSVFCRSFMTTLSDPKSTHDANSLKGIALDHFGSIASRLCQDLRSSEKEQLRSLCEIVTNGDLSSLEKLVSAQQTLIRHLSRSDASSATNDDSVDFTRMLFARELCQVLASSADLPLEAVSDADTNANIATACERLESLAKTVWESEDSEDVFGPTPEDGQPRIDAIALELSRSQPLANMYQGILSSILQASESPQVTFRTKALRAISLVVAQDPDLFHQPNVRTSIENRMHDQSPAVRDAAIELVGKYVVGRPDLAVQYLPKLLDRISDAGLSVRRRVVKLLRVLYGVIDDEKLKIEICRRLVYRVLDEDENVKDLAMDAVEDLWFGPPPKPSAQTSPASPTDLSLVVLGVAGVHDGRPPPVEEALRLIMSKHSEKGTSAPLDRLKEVMDTLIDSLVEDKREMDVIACVKTICVLSGVNSSLLSTAKASLLLPFLKSATTVEEQTIGDYLLKIFRGAVLATPKTATKFGRDLQTALLPMLNRPSPQLQTMQEVVSCFAAVVRTQTQDYETMIRAFGASLTRLVSEKNKLKNPEMKPKVNVRQLPMLCYLTSLLCEHGDFDRVRAEHPATATNIDKLSTNSIADLVYDTLVELHGLDLPPPIKSTILSSLSFLWRAHPTFMLETSSTDIIDAVFESKNLAAHVQVLRILQDFLAIQESSADGAKTKGKGKTIQQGVKMDELVGNVEGFADSGVASAVAQRYLNRVVASSLSTNSQLQRLGIDVVSQIARSGFIHPLALAPTLVALSACPDPQVAAKANSTLSILHQKHASLLVTRFLEPARASHGYAKAAAGSAPVRGYRGDPPDSAFGRWFSLIHKEKRQVQLDYLKQLSRAFEIEPGSSCSENDVSFARFVAEAMSTLDYKRNEELMLVISRLNAILAVSGLQILHLLEESLSGGGGLLALANMDEDEAGSISGSPVKSAVAENGSTLSPDLVRQSIISGLALLLRDHLKQLYSITDVKMSKYVAGKKSAIGDKSANRRNDAPFALGLDGYARMSFAVSPLASEDDFVAQRFTFMSLIRDDGTINSLEEVEDDDEA